MRILFEYGLFSFALSFVGVFLTRHFARKWGLLAATSHDRWHRKPTALYGGVGILFAFIVVGLIAYFNTSGGNRILYGALFVGGFGNGLLGLIDDIYKIKPVTKLIWQIIFASLYILAGGSFNIFQWGILNIFMTYLWFMGIGNAINLLDNMDGLASGVVILSSISTLIIMLISGDSIGDLSTLITVIFLASICGFWMFNYYPATIFMGDTGSLFLGFIVAAITIPGALSKYGTGAGSNYSSMLLLLIPVTILATPIFDTTFVTITRYLSGRSISQGGRDHSSHRLVGLGFSERLAVFILYTLTVIGCAVSILMIKYNGVAVFIFGIYFLLFALIGTYLNRNKVLLEHKINMVNNVPDKTSKNSFTGT